MFKKRNIFILLLVMVGVALTLGTYAQAFTYKDRVREPAMRTVMERINDELTATRYATTGNIFYVDSGIGSDSADGSKEKPFATLDYAVGKCTANNGDVIFVYPGHAENLAAADAVDVDVAGVRIIGLGEGANAPTFTYTAAAGEFVIGAASVYVENLRFKPAHADGITMGISVEAAGDNFKLVNCEFVAAATATHEFLDAIDLAALADDVTIAGVRYRDAGTSLCNHFIEAGNGVNKNLTVVGCDIFGDFAVSAIWSDAIDTGVFIAGNTISNTTASQHAIEFTTTASGNLVDNVLYTNAWATMLDPGSLKCFGNLGAITVDSNAVPIPLGDYLSGGGTAPGRQLPASTSVYDVFGAFTGPYNGAEQDDNVKASLDLAHTDLDAILLDTGTTIPGTITTAQADLDIITGADGVNLLTATQASIDAIETDTSTTIPGTITTAQNDLDIITGADGVNLLSGTQTSIDAIETDTSTTLPATLAAMPQTVIKSDGACLSGLDPLFTISGGPVRCKIVGLVTTVIGSNAANFRLQHITTTPAATVDLNAGAVAVTDDAAGTLYYNVGDTSVFTPSGGLGFAILNPVTIEEVEFILAPGVVQCLGDAANTGVIAWYMTFTPLSPSSTVTAAP